MPHNHADNVLLLRDGRAYLLLRGGVSGLILRDVQGVGGAGIAAGQFSRGRWRKLRTEEERARHAALAERAREQKRKAEANWRAQQKAEADRKAQRAVHSAALEGHRKALRNLYLSQAAQAAQQTAATMQAARMQALAAQTARQQEQSHAAARAQDDAEVAHLADQDRKELMQVLQRSGLAALLKTIK